MANYRSFGIRVLPIGTPESPSLSLESRVTLRSNTKDFSPVKNVAAQSILLRQEICGHPVEFENTATRKVLVVTLHPVTRIRGIYNTKESKQQRRHETLRVTRY